MGKTTIQLYDEVYEQLAEHKHENESFNDAVQRLLNDESGMLWDEDEIRRLAREEAEDVIAQYR